MASRNVIHRRTVLRGVLAGGIGVTVPLPRLIGMLNGNGTAYAADGAPLPVRFGTWFFGNGIIPERWVPARTGQGDNWTLSEQLAPLQGVKPWLSVITGCAIKTPDTSPHASMPAAALTGANVMGPTVALPSVDQIVAKITGAGTPFPTGLHVGVSNTSGGSSLGTQISFSGPNANTGMPGTTPPPTDPDLLRRNKVLDAVNEDAKDLRARLGTEDQARFDAHLEGIKQIQLQIQRATGPKVVGKLVDPDKAYATRGGDGSITRARSQAFADLLVFAMSTDLTRVFSFMFTAASCHGNYADCGLDNTTFHEDYGHRLSPKGQAYATAGFNTGVRFAMSNFNDLLSRMKNTADGPGNLLDNSCVYATSCTSESQTHSNLDYPLLVAGTAGGKIKGDQHLRFPGENSSKMPFTLITAMGSTAKTFGNNEGQVTATLPGLLT
jgi:hypothetical protein